MAHLDDLIAGLGFALVLAGLYVWLGAAAPLIAAGLTLIFVGWRLPTSAGEQNEPD